MIEAVNQDITQNQRRRAALRRIAKDYLGLTAVLIASGNGTFASP